MEFSWGLAKVRSQRASGVLGSDSRECVGGSKSWGVPTLGKHMVLYAVKMDVWSNPTSVAWFEAVVDQYVPLSERIKQKVRSV